MRVEPPPVRIPTRSSAIKIVLGYLALAGLWVLGSAWTLQHIARQHALDRGDHIAGWVFILSTALLLGLGLDRYFALLRRSARALQESETRWRKALEGASQATWDWNPQTNEVFYSPEWKTMLGYGPQELGNTTEEWESRVHPEDLPRVLAEVNRHLDGQTPQYVSEHRLRCKDGSYKWILDRGKVTDRSADGKPLRVVGTQADISQRKRAEEALAASEARFRALFDYCPDGILVVDAENRRVLSANESMCRLLGYGAEELSRLSVTDLHPPEALPKVAAHFQSLAVDSEHHAPAVPVLRKGGSIFLADISASHYTVGGQGFMVGQFRDITQRKQAEQALLESETNFRNFFQTIDDLMLVATLDGRLVFGNAAVERKLGFTQEDLATMSVPDLHPPELRAEAGEILAAILRNERQTCPLPFQRKDGGLLPVETRAWRGHWNGQPCLFGVCKDLSAEQEAQQRFERLFRHNPMPMALTSLPDRKFEDVNDAWLETLGYKRNEVVGRAANELDLFPIAAQQEAAAAQLMKTGAISNIELQVRTRDRTLRDGLFSGEILQIHGKSFLLTVMTDVTERKQAERMRTLSADVLRILNDPQALPDATQRILDAIQRETGIEAAGIRLRQAEDFPYAVTNGFSPEFLQAENSLAARTPAGEFCLNEDGKLRLECTCGLVLTGQTDPGNPLFTPGGSAWTNDARPLLDVPAEQDPRFQPRNRCIHEGYQSVALIPIRVEEAIVGLLQLNDHRKNCFTADMIRYLEGLAASFGVALVRLKEEQAVRESQRTLRALFDAIPESLFLMNLEGNVLAANTGFAHRFNRRVEECVGSSLFELLPKHLEESRRFWMAEVVRSRGTVVSEEAWGKRWLRHNYSPVFGAQGQVDRIVVLAVDITDRKRAEAGLRQWADAFEHCAHGIGIGLPDTNEIMVCNPAFARMLGRTIEEVKGRPILSVYVPEDHEKIRAWIAEADQTGQVRYESRMVRADGSSFPVQMDVVSVCNASGRLIYRVATAQDITERQQAEAELRKSLELQDQLARVAATVPGLICSFKLRPDGSTCMPFTTSAITEIYGLRPEDVREDFSPILALVHPEDQKHLQETIAESARTLQPWHDVFRARHPQRGEIWVEGTSMPGLEPDGSILWHGFVQDVTDRKRAEMELRRQEARLRLALEAAGMITWELDIASGRLAYSSNLPVMAGSPEVAQYMTLDSLLEQVHPEDRASTSRAIEHTMRSGAAFDHEYRVKAPDGTYRWLAGKGRLMLGADGDNRFTHVLGISQDITGRREAEASLRQSELRFRKMFENAPDGLVILDPDSGKILAANPAAVALYEAQTEADLIDRIPWEVSPQTQPDGCPSKEKARDMIEKAAREGFVSFEWMHRRLDQQDFLSTVQLVRVDQGDHALLQATIRDITERRRLERDREAALAKYQTLFDSLPLGVTVADKTGRIIESNQMAEQILGISSAEHLRRQIGSSEWRIIRTDGTPMPPEEYASVRALREGCTVRDVEMGLVKSPTETTWITVTAAPVPLPDVGVVITYSDISARKRAEAALRLSETKYRIVAENNFDWEFWLSPEGRFLYTSPSCERITGHRGAEFEADPDLMSRILHPEDRARYQAHCGESLHGKQEPEQEFRLSHANGETRWIGHVCTPIWDGEGGFLGVRGSNRDITARKQAEEALRQSEELLRQMGAVAKVGGWEFDVATGEGRWTEEVARIHDLAPDMTTSKALGLSFYHGESRVRIEAAIEKSLTEGIPYDLELELVTAKGTHKWVRTIAQPIKIDGRVVRLRGSFQDITERKQAEEALRQSEKRFRSLFQDIPSVAVQGYGPDGTTRYWNQASEQLYGYTAQEAVGRSLLDLIIPPEMRDDVRQAVEQMARTGQPIPASELSLMRKDGSRVPVYSSHAIIPSPDGIPELFCVDVDLTELKRAEATLRESEERFRSVVEAAAIPIFVSLEMKFTYLNPAALRLLGAETGEPLIGQLVLTRIHPDYHESVRQRAARVFGGEKGAAPPQEEVYLRLDGTPVSVEATASPIVYQGQPGAVVFVQDITERKQAQDALAAEVLRRRILIDGSRDGIVVLDQNGKVFEANRQFAESLGYTPEEIQHLHVWDWDQSWPRERVLEAIHALGPEGARFESRHWRKDGSCFDVTLSNSAAYLAGQKLVFCVCHDITLRKRAEMELRESEERFRAVVEGASIPVFVGSADMRFTYLNPAALRLFGARSMEDLAGKPVFSLIHPDFHDTIRLRSERVFKGQDQVAPPLREVYLRLDGSPVDVEVSASPIYFQGQKSAVIFVQDITDRLKAESALHESLLFRREAEKIGRIGAWKVSPETDYLYWTEGVYEIVEAPPDYKPGLKEGLKFYDAASIPTLQAALQAAWSDGTPFTLEVGLTTMTGRHIWTEVRGLGRMEEGGTSYVMGTFQDITHRKQRENRDYHYLRALQLLAANAPLRKVLEAILTLLECDRDDWMGSIMLADDTATHLYCGAALRLPDYYQEAVNGVPIAVGSGSCGTAAATKQPVIVEDITTHAYWADYRETATRAGLRACWSMPIVSSAGDVLGALAVYHSKPSLPTAEELKDIEGVMDLAGVAIGKMKAEQALREREETFSSIVGQAADAITVLDAATGRFVEFNAAAHEGLGYTREEFSGFGVADIQAEHSLEVIRQNNAKAREQDRVTFESKHRHRNGSLRDVRVSIRRLHIRDRDYLAAVWTDITERKQAEARTARDTLRTEFLLELHQRAPQMTDRELYDHVLDRAVRLTDSAIGFFHQVSDDQQYIILTPWKQETVSSGSESFDIHFPVNQAGNWVDCIHQQRAVIWNDHARSPNQRWLPEGHASVVRFMSIPVNQDGKVRIIFGVGNKAVDYTQDDVIQLQVVANELHKLMAQRAAQKQLRQLSRAVEQSTVSVIITDTRGTIEYVNPRFTEVTGYTFEEVQGRNPRVFKSGKTSSNEYHRLWETILAGGEWHGELLNRKKSGQLHWESVSISPITDSNATITHFVAIKEDITDRKRAELELRASEARYRTVLDAMTDSIHVTDLDQSLVLVNETCRQWCVKAGLDEPETGLHLKNSLPFLPFQLDSDQLQKLTIGTPVASTGKKMLLKDRELIVDVRHIPIQEHGQTNRIMTVVRDVTDVRRLETQFLRAQRMESLGTLAAGIAHDLNNVLAPVLMLAPLIRDQLPDPQTRNLVESVETSAQRGADIVRQMLVFSRGVEGDQTALRLGDLVKEITKIAREVFPKDLAVLTDVPRDLWMISGNSTHLHQVLMNLSVNARDAMPHGGTLAYSAENQVLDATYAGMAPWAKPGAYVVVKVRDTGTGIPPEVMEKIFDPFFTTKEVGKGTGLGLSTVQGIIKSHGGFIEVDSQVGQGTEFRLFLPAIESSATAQAAADTELVARGKGQTLLVVDDEPVVRRVLQETLRKFGYRVVVAQNGVEALAVFSAHRQEIAAVITDLAMPEMNGLLLTRALRRSAPDVKIIVSTGQVDTAQIEAFEALGVKHLLDKPYKAQVLLTALEELLKHQG